MGPHFGIMLLVGDIIFTILPILETNLYFGLSNILEKMRFGDRRN